MRALIGPRLQYAVLVQRSRKLPPLPHKPRAQPSCTCNAFMHSKPNGLCLSSDGGGCLCITQRGHRGKVHIYRFKAIPLKGQAGTHPDRS